MIREMVQKDIQFAERDEYLSKGGFRKYEYIKSSLESELFFYSKVLKFTAFDKLNNIKIENSERL